MPYHFIWNMYRGRPALAQSATCRQSRKFISECLRISSPRQINIVASVLRKQNRFRKNSGQCRRNGLLPERRIKHVFNCCPAGFFNKFFHSFFKITAFAHSAPHSQSGFLVKFSGKFFEHSSCRRTHKLPSKSKRSLTKTLAFMLAFVKSH